jgi:hypothetical protein
MSHLQYHLELYNWGSILAQKGFPRNTILKLSQFRRGILFCGPNMILNFKLIITTMYKKSNKQDSKIDLNQIQN